MNYVGDDDFERWEELSCSYGGAISGFAGTARHISEQTEEAAKQRDLAYISECFRTSIEMFERSRRFLNSIKPDDEMYNRFRNKVQRHIASIQRYRDILGPKEVDALRVRLQEAVDSIPQPEPPPGPQDLPVPYRELGSRYLDDIFGIGASYYEQLSPAPYLRDIVTDLQAIGVLLNEQPLIETTSIHILRSLVLKHREAARLARDSSQGHSSFEATYAQAAAAKRDAETFLDRLDRLEEEMNTRPSSSNAYGGQPALAL